MWNSCNVNINLQDDIKKAVNEKISEIFADFQKRMYIENYYIPFDLGIELDEIQSSVTNIIMQILKYQQGWDDTNESEYEC